MPRVELSCGSPVPLECRALTGRERIGETFTFDLDLFALEPIETADIQARILGKPAALRITSATGERTLHGIVTRFAILATSQTEPGRRYKLTLRAACHTLTLRRRTRVFQRLSAPDIIERVLLDAGFGPDTLESRLADQHPEREYTVQYAETDAAFLRRICEEDGLYFRFEPRDDVDAIVLEDSSPQAPRALEDPLPLADESALAPDRPMAFACEAVRQRRPGKVTLRDHDVERPRLKLEAAAQGGADHERAVEVYRAPGRFKTPAEGTTRARMLLESLRAEAETIRFSATAIALAPGRSFKIEITPDYAGAARPEGEHLVVEVEHRWSFGETGYVVQVAAIPLRVPYRLPHVTPRPRINGVHPAIVTGAPGEEIHTDAAGRVNVRFFWDREGPADHRSSLPVRVVQQNLPGAMLIPRVGSEVLVAFEDGDPDRPYVLGRAYNARQPPPFALPANKTISSLGTTSSPGGARKSAVHVDDAAGRQAMIWTAAFGKTTVVANNMVTQTVGFEAATVKGSQARDVGGNQDVSVKSASVVDVGAQTASVSGNQDVLVKGALAVKVGSETVTVGGALLEQVGSPKAGALHFAETAGLRAAGSIPFVGPFLAKGYSSGKALVEAYQKSDGNTDVVAAAAGRELAGFVGDMIPAGDALIAAADATGQAPWAIEETTAARGAEEAGGGVGGPGAAAASAAPGGAGHRVTSVKGAVTEAIGGAYSVTTPGSIQWTTAGASSILVGGSHATSAITVSRLTGGISVDTAASIQLQASGVIGRTVTGSLSTSIAGSLTSQAGGAHTIKAGGALTLKVGGSLSASGGKVVFACGGSALVASPGGVLLKASKVTINGVAKQSGKATNAG